MKAKFAVVVLILCFKFALGQTAADIDMKYGKRVDVYAVSEHIWMTPEYGDDGQVCKVRLYPKRIARNTNYLSKQLPFEELREALQSLVPLDKRGWKRQSFGVTATGGPAAWTTYPYERVTFIFVSSFSASTLVDSSPLIKGEYVFPTPELSAGGESESSTPSDNDFLPSLASGILLYNFLP